MGVVIGAFYVPLSQLCLQSLIPLQKYLPCPLQSAGAWTMDHGCLHGLCHQQWRNRPPVPAVWVMDTNVAAGSKQHRPVTVLFKTILLLKTKIKDTGCELQAVAQLVSLCWPHKHEDQSLDLQHQHQKSGPVVYASNPRAEEAEAGR